MQTSPAKAHFESMDDDEITVNTSLTASKTNSSLPGKGSSMDVVKLFDPESANMLELACIAISNMSCNSNENKLCFMKFKVHSILRIIVRNDYHQAIHAPEKVSISSWFFNQFQCNTCNVFADSRPMVSKKTWLLKIVICGTKVSFLF